MRKKANEKGELLCLSSKKKGNEGSFLKKFFSPREKEREFFKGKKVSLREFALNCLR